MKKRRKRDRLPDTDAAPAPTTNDHTTARRGTMKGFGNLRVGLRLGIASGVLAALLVLLMVMAFRGESQMSHAMGEIRKAGTQLDESGDLRVATLALDTEQTS